MALDWLWRVGLLALVATAGTATWMRRPDAVRDHVDAVRRRWLWGLPLASIVVILMNGLGYLLLQRGLWHYGDPLALPFYSWTYRYPVGLLASPFTHAGPGHLAGNLTSAAVMLPAAEYVLGHGSGDRRRRALVELPLLLYGIGVAVSALSWGPVIGFSGVLFVVLGFLLVLAPTGAVAAVLGGRIVGVVASAAAEPVTVRSAGTEFVTPWWANIAVESHALGLLLGAGLGVLYARRAGRPVDGMRTGVAVVLIAVLQNLWAVWMPTDAGFVLYRALGVGLVAVGAALLGGLVAVEADADPLLEQETISGTRALVLLGFLAPLVVFAGMAVAVNAVGVVDTGPPAAVEVGDYDVTYGENVTNGWLAAAPYLSWTGADGTADGVIVRSVSRGIWIEQIERERLRHSGSVSFHVGGPTWERRVTARREGMETVSGDRTYDVGFVTDGETAWVGRDAVASTDTTVAGWRVALGQRGPERHLVLRRDGVERRIGLAEDPTSTAGVTAWIDDGSVRVAAENLSTVVGHVD